MLELTGNFSVIIAVTYNEHINIWKQILKMQELRFTQWWCAEDSSCVECAAVLMGEYSRHFEGALGLRIQGQAVQDVRHCSSSSPLSCDSCFSKKSSKLDTSTEDFSSETPKSFLILGCLFDAICLFNGSFRLAAALLRRWASVFLRCVRFSAQLEHRELRYFL